jgi:ATP-binding cassette subfamily B protein
MRPDVSSTSIEDAARRSGLPTDLLDQEVGIEGRSLSGGQRQRVALARALAGPRGSVLIMDEPTSALDSHTEAFIHQSFRELAADHLVFIISHRPATLMCCDRVVVLSDGVVAGQGPWDEIKALCTGL